LTRRLAGLKRSALDCRSGAAWRLLSRLRLTFLDGQIPFLKAHMDRSIDPRFDANVTAAAEHLN